MSFWDVYNKPTPCLGCKDRHPHCHSECEAYAEFRAKQDMMIEMRVKMQEAEQEFFARTNKKQR